MASRTLSRAFRSPLTKQLSAPARRTFVSALNASARPTARAAVAAAQQQVRGVKTIDFAGVKEDVYGIFYYRQSLGLKTNKICRASGLARCKTSGIFTSPQLTLRQVLTWPRNTSRMIQWPLLVMARKGMLNL